MRAGGGPAADDYGATPIDEGNKLQIELSTD
jgi:hypothetical protein